MSKHSADDHQEGGRSRPWADLCPDLLQLIYSDLPSNYMHRRSGFGSVCKNWRRFHSAAAAASAAKRCTRTSLNNYIFTIGTRLDQQNLELESAIPVKTRRKLYGSYIVHVELESNSGWWLLRNHGGKIFSCFNPLLRWPESYIPLPELTINPDYRADGEYTHLRIAVAFINPPDWMLLVIQNRRSFSTIRRGQCWWRSYRYSTRGSCEGMMINSNNQISGAVFNNGEFIIWDSTDSDGWFPVPMMLKPTTPLEPWKLRLAGKVVVRWVRQGRNEEYQFERDATTGNQGEIVEIVGKEELNAIKRDYWEVAVAAIHGKFTLVGCCSAAAGLLILSFSTIALLYRSSILKSCVLAV